MANKIIDKITGNSGKTATGGVIREYPFGSAIKGIFVLSSTGSGIASTDTLQVLVSEMDWSSAPSSNETATQLNIGLGTGSGTPLLSHLIITGSQLNSLGQGPMPIYDVRDFIENPAGTAGTITSYSGSIITGSFPRVISPLLSIKWNITGSGTWTFRYYLCVEQ